MIGIHPAIWRAADLKAGRYLLAVLDTVCLDLGTRILDTSSAELGELLGLSSDGAIKAIERLAERGWVHIIARPRPGGASVWSLEIADPDQPRLVGQREEPRLFADPQPPEPAAEDPPVIGLARVGEAAAEVASGAAAWGEARNAEEIELQVSAYCEALPNWSPQSTRKLIGILVEEDRRRVGRERPKWTAWREATAKLEARQRRTDMEPIHNPGAYLRRLLDSMGLKL